MMTIAMTWSSVRQRYSIVNQESEEWIDKICNHESYQSR
jgi:hypothetical protein